MKNLIVIVAVFFTACERDCRITGKHEVGGGLCEYDGRCKAYGSKNWGDAFVLTLPCSVHNVGDSVSIAMP